MIARVICISLFYQNPIGFFFSILFETLPNFKVVYHEIIKNIEFSLLKHKYWACAEHSMSRAKTSTIPQVNNSIIDQNVQALF
nr:hypothetical protein [Acinetobacter baumannii]